MMPITPSPASWTLRFKNQRSTAVLHVDPLQTLESIKKELLHALRETHPNGMLGTQPIPSEASDVLLARPNDMHNLDKGWVSLVDSEGNVITGNEPVTKKRKTDEGELKVQDQCPKAVGIRDGFILAYKFREHKAIDNAQEDGEEEEEQWDVIMPSLEEGLDSQM